MVCQECQAFPGLKDPREGTVLRDKLVIKDQPGLVGIKGEPGIVGSSGRKGEKGEKGESAKASQASVVPQTNWKQCVWKSQSGTDNGKIKVNRIRIIAHS